jgi:HSP20 family protein
LLNATMSIIKWDESLRNLEGLLDRSTFAWPWAKASRDLWHGFADWNPRVDIQENENTYVLNADIPGVEKADLKVTVEDRVLTISGERKVEHRQDNARVHRLERLYGSFSRSFTLPQDADADAMTAKSAKGQLEVTIPKSVASRPEPGKQIPIE